MAPPTSGAVIISSHVSVSGPPCGRCCFTLPRLSLTTGKVAIRVLQLYFVQRTVKGSFRPARPRLHPRPPDRPVGGRHWWLIQRSGRGYFADDGADVGYRTSGPNPLHAGPSVRMAGLRELRHTLQAGPSTRIALNAYVLYVGPGIIGNLSRYCW